MTDVAFPCAGTSCSSTIRYFYTYFCPLATSMIGHSPPGTRLCQVSCLSALPSRVAGGCLSLLSLHGAEHNNLNKTPSQPEFASFDPKTTYYTTYLYSSLRDYSSHHVRYDDNSITTTDSLVLPPQNQHKPPSCGTHAQIPLLERPRER